VAGVSPAASKASIFHTPGWLGALWRTYGYEPVVFTTSAPNAQLQNGVLFCHVNSWLTGRRLVSLPFSDHCQPLLDGGGELQTVLEYLEQEARRERWKYVSCGRSPIQRSVMLGLAS